jgi:hypothetical protein
MPSSYHSFYTDGIVATSVLARGRRPHGGRSGTAETTLVGRPYHLRDRHLLGRRSGLLRVGPRRDQLQHPLRPADTACGSKGHPGRAAGAHARVATGDGHQAARQLHQFANEMDVGDAVVTPTAHGRSASVGIIVGEYEYVDTRPGFRHVRAVRWVTHGIDRHALSTDSHRELSQRPTVSGWPSAREACASAAATPSPRGETLPSLLR